MTGFQLPDMLREYRGLLLACEAIGWLHMAGKAKIDFLRMQGNYDYKKWHEQENPPFPWDDLHYIARTYFSNREWNTASVQSEPTRTEQQQTVNSGKFRVKTEPEQQVWNECSRLIANAVIYYNSAVLSRLHEQKKAADDQAALDIIQGISPVAWQHVHLVGKFEFSPSAFQVDIDALAARYDDLDYWNKALHKQSEEDLRD